MPTSIPLPQIYWGKRKQRSQMCEVHTLDRKIVEVELEVVRFCAADSIKNLAFLLDGENQYFSDKNYWVQILDERSLYPVCSIKKRDETKTKDLLLQIYREAKKQAKAEQYKKRDTNRMTAFVMIVSIFCTTMIVIAGMAWLRGG